MVGPEDVLAFWLDECSPADWYKSDPAFDAVIVERFSEALQDAADGALGLWLTYPSGVLAYIILTDQFPRNMFRDSGKAFATDHLARAAAKMAIDRQWDMKIDEPARQFFYLPLMHAENLCDQDRAVRLIHTRMPETGESNRDHACAHRAVFVISVASLTATRLWGVRPPSPSKCSWMLVDMVQLFARNKNPPNKPIAPIG